MTVSSDLTIARSIGKKQSFDMIRTAQKTKQIGAIDSLPTNRDQGGVINFKSYGDIQTERQAENKVISCLLFFLNKNIGLKLSLRNLLYVWNVNGETFLFIPKFPMKHRIRDTSVVSKLEPNKIVQCICLFFHVTAAGTATISGYYKDQNYRFYIHGCKWIESISASQGEKTLFVL